MQDASPEEVHYRGEAVSRNHKDTGAQIFTNEVCGFLSIGIFALYHGYKEHHHRLLPILLFSGGISFLLLKEWFHQYHVWLLIPAVLLIVFAHYLNYRLCRKAAHCHADDCNH